MRRRVAGDLEDNRVADQLVGTGEQAQCVGEAVECRTAGQDVPDPVRHEERLQQTTSTSLFI